jgi:hypothetical protein
MKIQIRASGMKCHQWHRLSVDKYLPSIYLPECAVPDRIRVRGPYSETRDAIPLDRPRARRFAAVRLARINRGQTPFEMDNPVETFGKLVDTLSLIPGLLQIGTSTHYSIEYRVGDLFDADEVGLALATLLRDCFYPSEQISVFR